MPRNHFTYSICGLSCISLVYMACNGQPTKQVKQEIHKDSITTPKPAIQQQNNRANTKDTVVISDNAFDIFLKRFDKKTVSTGAGDAPYNELWIRYRLGKEELLLACRNSGDPDSTIADMSDVQLSNDKKNLYFLSGAYATSSTLHVVNIETKAERFVCAANFLRVIRNGKYKNDMIVNQHRLRVRNGEGEAFDSYYIVNEKGRTLKALGDSNKEYGLKADF